MKRQMRGKDTAVVTFELRVYRANFEEAMDAPTRALWAALSEQDKHFVFDQFVQRCYTRLSSPEVVDVQLKFAYADTIDTLFGGTA